MTRVFDEQHVPHEVHFALVHTIRNIDDWKHEERFILTRSPVTTGWNKQRVLNEIKQTSTSWELPKTPWTTQRYKNMVQAMADMTALVGSGYFAPGEFL